MSENMVETPVCRVWLAEDGIIRPLALLVGSPISKVIGSFFLGLNKPRFPTKLFASETKAVEWLETFVQ